MAGSAKSKGGSKDTGANAGKPGRQGSGDSPKRQGDKLERARDAAAGRSKTK
jgi:hypothetical protein